MSDFLDAFGRGQALKQAQVDREKAAEAAFRKRLDEGIAAARKWVTDVVDPVVKDASAEIQSFGSIRTADTSNPPKVGCDINFTLTGKPAYKLSFVIHENGVINSFRGVGGQKEDFGTIANADAVKVRQLVLTALAEIGAS
jgi:hypothetical protein